MKNATVILGLLLSLIATEFAKAQVCLGLIGSPAGQAVKTVFKQGPGRTLHKFSLGPYSSRQWKASTISTAQGLVDYVNSATFAQLLLPYDQGLVVGKKYRFYLVHIYGLFYEDLFEGYSAYAVTKVSEYVGFFQRIVDVGEYPAPGVMIRPENKPNENWILYQQPSKKSIRPFPWTTEYHHLTSMVLSQELPD